MAHTRRMFFNAAAYNAGFDCIVANTWYCSLTHARRKTATTSELMADFVAWMPTKYESVNPRVLLPDIDLTSYPEHQQFRDRARRAGGAHEHIPCILCGAPTKDGNLVLLQLAHGGFTVTDPRDPTADRWTQPIGPTCLKRHPELKPYIAPKES